MILRACCRHFFFMLYGWFVILIVFRKYEVSVLMKCPACDFKTKEVTEYRKHLRCHRADVQKRDLLVFTCEHCKDR